MRHTVTQGTVGLCSPIVGTLISLMPQIEAWLRITSLVVGIGVGVASFVSIIRRMRGK